MISAFWLCWLEFKKGLEFAYYLLKKYFQVRSNVVIETIDCRY